MEEKVIVKWEIYKVINCIYIPSVFRPIQQYSSIAISVELRYCILNNNNTVFSSPHKSIT